VAQDVAGRQALVRVEGQGPANQVPGRFGDMVPVLARESEFAGEYGIEKFLLRVRFGAERRVAAQEDVGDDARRPDIHFNAVPAKIHDGLKKKVREGVVLIYCDQHYWRLEINAISTLQL